MTDQESKALYIAQKCVAAGMTIAGAAGVLINIQNESAFSSINVEDRYHKATGKSDEYYTNMVDMNPSYDFETDNGGRYGYGLCQWTYPTRKREMRQFHNSRGVSIGDRDTQIEFMLLEMKRDFRDVWTACTSSQSAYNCAYLYCKKFENPINAEAQATSRASSVQRWVDFLTEHIDDQTQQPEPTPQPAPTPTVDHRLVLRTIDKNCESFEEFRLLTSVLVLRKYPISNIWASVVQFQKDNGLDADGVVGPKTYNALLSR